MKPACNEFGEENIRIDEYSQKSGGIEFPVLARDGRIGSSLSFSQTLNQIPIVHVGYVFVETSLLEGAFGWLNKNRNEIIKTQMELEV